MTYAWDNVEAHRAINKSAVKYFISQYKDDPKYAGGFDETKEYSGYTYWIEPGVIDEYKWVSPCPTKNFMDWIAEGGFTADVNPTFGPGDDVYVKTDW